MLKLKFIGTAGMYHVFQDAGPQSQFVGWIKKSSATGLWLLYLGKDVDSSQYAIDAYTTLKQAKQVFPKLVVAHD